MNAMTESEFMELLKDLRVFLKTGIETVRKKDLEKSIESSIRRCAKLLISFRDSKKDEQKQMFGELLSLCKFFELVIEIRNDQILSN